jgi:hypothetical protein
MPHCEPKGTCSACVHACDYDCHRCVTVPSCQYQDPWRRVLSLSLSLSHGQTIEYLCVKLIPAGSQAASHGGAVHETAACRLVECLHFLGASPADTSRSQHLNAWLRVHADNVTALWHKTSAEPDA